MIDESETTEKWTWRDDVGSWWACYKTPKGNPAAGKWVKPPKGYLPIHGVNWNFIMEGSVKEADRIGKLLAEAGYHNEHHRAPVTQNQSHRTQTRAG